MLLRLGAGAIGVTVAFVIGAGALGARISAAPARGAEPAARATFTVVQASSAVAPPGPIALPAIDVDSGRSALRDGIYAQRTRDDVTVLFDTPLYRTRRRDKLESTIRATLPAIYGAVADSLLSAIPLGQLLPAGDLLADLPTRPVHLAHAGGFEIVIWPVTRPGQDGPLVVSYRTSLARTKR